MSVCNAERLALFVVFASYLLTYYTVCLRGECLSLSPCPLSPAASLSILQAVCQSGAAKLPSHLGSAVHEYSSHRCPLLLLFTHNLKVNMERMTPNVRKLCLFQPIFHTGISWLVRRKTYSPSQYFCLILQ